MALTQDDLLQIQSKIAEAKNKAAELTGARTQLMVYLKDTYGCETLDDAKKLKAELGEEIRKIQRKLDEGLKDLEQKYDLEELL